MMQEHIGRLMAQLEKHSAGGRPVDVREWFTFSMFDINSDFGFSEDMGCVKNGTKAAMHHTFKTPVYTH